MSNRSPITYQGGETGEPLSNLIQLFRQMTLLPFSTFVYSLEVFIQTLKGLERMAENGIDAMANSPAQPSGPGQSVESAPFGGAPAQGVANQKSTLKEEKKMSDQTWTSREQQSSSDESWSMSEDCTKKDPCDRLRLVRYKVLFLKDKLEVAFQEDEELVSEDMTKEGFISWKVAEFIQRLQRKEVRQPRKWHDRNNYPANNGGKVDGAYPNSYVTDLPDKDKKYLRVYSDVLAWYDRERKNYEREKVDALEEIRNELKGLKIHSGPTK